MSKSRKTRDKEQQASKGRRGRKSSIEIATPPYGGSPVPLEPIDGVRWRIPKKGLMRVDGVIYAGKDLLPDLREDRCLEQVANVATLPGIVGESLAMPDIHWGYGFPIGGVAAFDEEEGVVSPGGVGYDINCGVRLLVSDLPADDPSVNIRKLTQALYEAIPAGVGSKRKDLRISAGELDQVMQQGVGWAAKNGFAEAHDAEHIEEGGCLPNADPSSVSSRARLRGRGQLGTLGSGNHFAEIGMVDTIYQREAARAFGLKERQITLMIHSGSRGLGHQVCTDSLQEMLRAVERYEIPLVDRQLCCSPITSSEAKRYLGAMAAAANYAFVNRQVMTHWARQVFKRLYGASLITVYDVCHNIAKFERHLVDGVSRRLLVHRKGATRALSRGHEDLPAAYRDAGQPVIIPGDMGRYSFVLRGAQASERTFASACHGAGRLLSRSEAKRRFASEDVAGRLACRGIVVIGASRATVIEEVPEAYKDVARVVDAVQEGGLADKVARIRPIGCVKG